MVKAIASFARRDFIADDGAGAKGGEGPAAEINQGEDNDRPGRRPLLE
jgi:hypothetical protein